MGKQGLIIPDDVRATAIILHKEGNSERKIAQTLDISAASVHNILHEDHSAYEYKVERIKKESLHNWRLIREKTQGLVLKQIEESEEAGDNLDMRALTTLMGVSQDKEQLLAGSPTERHEITGEFKAISEMTPQEQRDRLNELRRLDAERLPAPQDVVEEEAENNE